MFSAGVVGTTGHTLIGMMPELGIIYTGLTAFLLYNQAWKGNLSESFILSLTLTIFIPISYIAPILCIALIKDKYIKLSKKDYVLNNNI